MSSCQKCKSDRIVMINAKCNDTCQTVLGDVEEVGYLPDVGIGHGDYIDFEFCADCGQIQGDFPLQPTSLEKQGNEDEQSED